MKYKQIIMANICLLALWQGSSLLVNKAFLPGPQASFSAFIQLVMSQELLKHFAVSFYRVVMSILLAVLFALPLGIAMGYREKWDTFFSPFITILYPLPKIVFLPVLVVFMGLGNAPKILLIFLILFFQILVSVRDTVKRIPRESFLSMYSMTQSFWNLLLHLIFPWCLPDFLTAIRISVGTSVAVLFFVETFASFDGLGYLILNGMERREYPEMYAGIIGMALLGLLLYLTIFLLEKKYCKWKVEFRKRAM